MQTFLAPEFPSAYLLPWQGDKITGKITVGIFWGISLQGDNRGKVLVELNSAA